MADTARRPARAVVLRAFGVILVTLATIGGALGLSASPAAAWHGNVVVDQENCDGWAVHGEATPSGTDSWSYNPAASGDWSGGNTVNGTATVTWSDSDETYTYDFSVSKPGDCEQPPPADYAITANGADCTANVTWSTTSTADNEGASLQLFDQDNNLFYSDGNEVLPPNGSKSVAIPDGVTSFSAVVTWFLVGLGDATGEAFSGQVAAECDEVPPPDKPISAKALGDHECVDYEWHFVITQVDSEADAPDSITVTWANGNSEVVPLDKFTGGVAHYATTSNLDSTVVSATTDIYVDWGGQFNLSHGPCGPPPTTAPPTTAPPTTAPPTTAPPTTVPGPTTTVPGPTTTVPGPTTTVPGPTTTVPGVTTTTAAPTPPPGNLPKTGGGSTSSLVGISLIALVAGLLLFGASFVGRRRTDLV